MTVTFVSNYINHHQIPFSNACHRELGEGYRFIQTQPMEEERRAMGWSADDSLPYVLRLYQEEELCRRLIRESDVVAFGWTGEVDLARERLEEGLPSVRVSERIYREGQWKAVSPRGLRRKYDEHIRYRAKPVCLLCAGAYTASDFHLIGAYPGKKFKWGYFPETRLYPEGPAELKLNDGKVHMVWAGRFIPLKHPEYVLRLAAELNGKFDFHIHMAGGGELEGQLKQSVLEQGLKDRFTFYGFCGPDKVRSIMEKCHIHLFTSDQMEGWGAVVNEAMNSGCAVAADVRAGSVPFLIRQGVNGLAWRGGDYEDFSRKVRFLLEHEEERRRMGENAWRTIAQCWNAEHAASEFLRFAGGLKRGEIVPAQDGPLSPAPVISPRSAYRRMTEG